MPRYKLANKKLKPVEIYELSYFTLKDGLEQQIRLNFGILTSSLIIDLGKNGFNQLNKISLQLNKITFIEYSKILISLYCDVIDNRFVEIPLNPDKNLKDKYSKFTSGCAFGRYNSIYLNLNFDDKPLNKNINVSTKGLNILKIEKGTVRMNYGMIFKNNIPTIISNYPLTKISDTKFMEGYWSNVDDFDSMKYPQPLATDIPVNKDFLDKLKRINEKAYQIHYLGFSHCRICKCLNGTAEYVLSNENIQFNYPEGLLHYYEKHNVKPSDEFFHFIMDYNEQNILPKKPDNFLEEIIGVNMANLELEI